MIEEMIAKKLKIDVSEVTDDKHLIDDLGADSLDTVELVMELETEFGIEIPDDAAETILSVGDAISFIDSAKS